MYKNVISIPVYTKPEVIIDQLINFHIFNPEDAIVLHFNPVFSWESDYISSIEEFVAIIDKLDYVYVNSERVRCGLYDIIGAHMSNFKYMCKTVDFEYFTFAASNELYCKSGRNNLLFGQSALTTHRKIDVTKSSWRQLEGVEEDIYYPEIFPHLVNNQYLYCGFCEGTSYKREIFEHMVGMIEEKYDHSYVPVLYAREEIYFPQALRCLVGEEDIVYKITTYMPWKKGMLVSCVDICDIIDNTKDYYSAKRIDLNLLDSTRAFIRQYVGQYHEQLEELLGKKVKRFTSDELSVLDYSVIEKQNKIYEDNQRREENGMKVWFYV